jgi:hypothetical protein
MSHAYPSCSNKVAKIAQSLTRPRWSTLTHGPCLDSAKRLHEVLQTPPPMGRDKALGKQSLGTACEQTRIVLIA